MVNCHTRLARRQQRLRRHDGIPLNPTRRTPRQDHPIAACRALVVVNRIAGVVHRLDRTPEETPRRTLCGWHFGDVRLTKLSRLFSVRRACSVCFRGSHVPPNLSMCRPSTSRAWMGMPAAWNGHSEAWRPSAWTPLRQFSHPAGGIFYPGCVRGSGMLRLTTHLRQVAQYSETDNQTLSMGLRSALSARPHAERHPAPVLAQQGPAGAAGRDRDDNGWGYVVRIGQTVYFDHGTTPHSVLDAITSRCAFIYALEVYAQLMALFTLAGRLRPTGWPSSTTRPVRQH